MEGSFQVTQHFKVIAWDAASQQILQIGLGCQQSQLCPFDRSPKLQHGYLRPGQIQRRNGPGIYPHGVGSYQFLKGSEVVNRQTQVGFGLNDLNTAQSYIQPKLTNAIQPASLCDFFGVIGGRDSQLPFSSCITGKVTSDGDLRGTSYVDFVEPRSENIKVVARKT